MPRNHLRQHAVAMLVLLSAACPFAAFEVNVATDYGFDAADSTSYLQAALDCGANRAVVPDVGQDWVTRRLRFRSSTQEVVFEDVSDVSVIGYGATWRMDKCEFTSGEHRHAWRHCSVRGQSSCCAIVDVDAISVSGTAIGMSTLFH